LDRFHTHEFSELIDYFEENRLNMTEDNAERFREMLIVIAPIIFVRAHSSWDDDESPLNSFDLQHPNGEVLKKIFSIIGDPYTITKKALIYPQFCFEMMFCALFDNDRGGSDKLFQSCECLCLDVDKSSDWPGKKEEADLLDMTSIIEDAEGLCHVSYAWPNW
jgi:hypothetical protein